MSSLINDSFSVSDVSAFLTPIPQDACHFYYGYYTMSSDMGILLLKIALLFVALEFFHKVAVYIFNRFYEDYKDRKKKNETYINPNNLEK